MLSLLLNLDVSILFLNYSLKNYLPLQNALLGLKYVHFFLLASSGASSIPLFVKWIILEVQHLKYSNVLMNMNAMCNANNYCLLQCKIPTIGDKQCSGEHIAIRRTAWQLQDAWHLDFTELISKELSKQLLVNIRSETHSVATIIFFLNTFPPPWWVCDKCNEDTLQFKLDIQKTSLQVFLSSDNSINRGVLFYYYMTVHLSHTCKNLFRDYNVATQKLFFSLYTIFIFSPSVCIAGQRGILKFSEFQEENYLAHLVFQG